VWLARRFAPTMNLASVHGACRFLLCAAIAAPIPAALFASVMLYVMKGQPFIPTFQTWWFGHALGLAVITPFGLALTSRLSLTGWRRPSAC
jgi:integral membrane sensor domain MASE1